MSDARGGSYVRIEFPDGAVKVYAPGEVIPAHAVACAVPAQRLDAVAGFLTGLAARLNAIPHAEAAAAAQDCLTVAKSASGVRLDGGESPDAMKWVQP